MAEKFPLPNSVIITISEVDGTQKAVVCLTQNDFTGSSNTVTGDTFCGTEVQPGSKSQTLQLGYRRVWEPDNNHTSEQFLYNSWKNDVHLEWTIGPETPVTGDLIYRGTGYITNISNTNGTNALPSGTLTLTCDELMDIERFSDS